MNQFSAQTTSQNKQTFFIYLLLISLTLLTWGAGQLGFSGLYASLTMLFLALFKGQLIGDYFMLLKGINSWWRWVVVIWLMLIGILVTTAFVLTPTSTG
jgi:cytochrome c oxidase subunit 4